MIILHAGFLASHLCLWGEQPVQTGLPIGPKSTRKTKGPETPQPLPFDPGPSGLMSDLVEAGFKPASLKAKTESIIIWLPTLEGKPIPSSPLIAELSDGCILHLGSIRRRISMYITTSLKLLWISALAR